jgi:hypothetical protein
MTLPFDDNMISDHESKCDNEPKKSYEVEVFPGKIRIILVLALNSQCLHFI